MAEKKTHLSIVIRTVDQATAKIKAINARLDAVTKPLRNFKDALSDLKSKSGLDDVIGGFQGVGTALAGVLAKVAMVGGVVGAAVVGLFKLVDGFDDLGDKAESMGVSVDFLAQMRYAAERSGASVESLDSGLKGFTTSLGQARAGTGRMAAFLNKVSPALARQVKGAKSNEEAFDLMANAMAKVKDPAKRAALAQKAFGDASLAPLLAKGADGIKKLRDRYLDLAGSQKGAADEAGAVDDSLKDFKATTDGIKAALVQGLGPALKVIVDRLSAFFKENRANIAEWAAGLGKKLPGAVSSLVGAVRKVIDTIRPFVDSATKLKVIAVGLAAVIIGPLVHSIIALGVALLTTPVGWIVAGIAAIAAGAYLLITNWDAVSAFFTDLWDTVNAKFGWAVNIIKKSFDPFLKLPLFIISNWETLTGFFTTLWDNVTAVFQKAWKYIEPIVDLITGAVDKVTGAVGKIGSFVKGGGVAGMALRKGADILGLGSEKSIGAPDIDLSGSASSMKVMIEHKNAPPGTRTSVEASKGVDYDMTTGWQMGFAP